MCLIKHRSGAARSALTSSVRRALASFGAAPLLVALNVGGANVALAEDAPVAAAPDAESSAPAQLQEVVVSGSRITTGGFNAPTPVTVVSGVTLTNNATSNVADAINNLPDFVGSATPQSSVVTVTSGTQAVNGLNIGGLGANRTLVLVNGQRTVPSTLTSIVDISELPQQLIKSVDVVTGGASAGYGSDALTGIVNFNLEKKFEGLKAEVSGGETNFHDDRNWKFNLTGGTSFLEGRGHVEVSGEMSDDPGVLVANRPWTNNGLTDFVNNVNYTKNGLNGPQYLLRNYVYPSGISYGGTIVSGPLRGTVFGPGGVPFQEVLGEGAINANGALNTVSAGGSWQGQTVANVMGAGLAPAQRRQNIFLRSSYDINDTTEIYFQGSFAHLYSFSDSVPVFQSNLAINSNNAFLPANVQQQLEAAGPTFAYSTLNGDLGDQHPITDRQVERFLVGSDGQFNVFRTDWSWDSYLSQGASEQHVTSDNTINVTNYRLATNVVAAPAGNALGVAPGTPVCASSLTKPTNGCVPLNIFGTGVMSQAGQNYVAASPYSHARLTQTVGGLNFHGAPFQDWAGPVSFAFGAEWRREAVNSDVPQEFTTTSYFLSAGLPYSGAFSVAEGYLETNIPLARDLPFAKQLDLNAAVRETGYSTFGLTRTWKAGLNWSPIDDVRFRAMQSLDIREPTLVDLYQAGTVTSNNIVDQRTGVNIPYQSITTGNSQLQPERATNTVVGMVFQPAALPRFNASVDYYITFINQGIRSFSAQQLYSLCQSGNQAACATFVADPTVGTNGLYFTLSPQNFATEHAHRIEFATSYRLPMDEIVSSWKGNLGFDGSATHYISWNVNSGVPGTLPTNAAGSNANVTPGSMPNWKFQGAFNYTLDQYQLGLAVRGISSGLYSNLYVQCTSTCPVLTPAQVATGYILVSNNHLPGAMYLDLNASYHFDIGKASSEVYFSVRNVLDRDPPPVAQGPSSTSYDFPDANSGLYDVLGRVMRLGVRVQL